MTESAALGGGALWPGRVTARVARSLLKLSVVIVNDLTSGSCELVRGSKSTGPTSPFGVWASALSHKAVSSRERFRARADLLDVTNPPPPSPLPLATRV